MAKRKLNEYEFMRNFSYCGWSVGTMEVNGKVRHGAMFRLDKITDNEVAYLKKFCNVRLTSWQYRWAPEIKGPAVFIAY